jgi:hypothetical protein
MLTLSWSLRRIDGVTLIELVGRADERTRARVEITTNDPLWMPRRQGVPAAGWDESGYEGVFPAGDPVALGCATAAEPAEPPVEIVWAEPASEDDDSGFEPRIDVPDVDAEPASVVRNLGDPRPPRDAIPSPEPDGAPIDAVEQWLDAVDERLTRAERREADATAHHRRRLEADRAALARVERRIVTLSRRARTLHSAEAAGR